MTRSDGLARGLELFRRGAWGEAFALLSPIDRESPLDAEALEQLAMAAVLTGRDVEGEEYLTRAHQGYATGDDVEQAARCGFWLGFRLILRGETARGGGWLARTRRLLDERRHDSVVRGYLLLPDAIRAVRENNGLLANVAFRAAVEIAERFADRDLLALARMGEGRSMMRMGRAPEGVVLLDIPARAAVAPCTE